MDGQTMKQTIFTLICAFLVGSTLSGYARVVPSATADRYSLYVGGMGPSVQPDYAGNGIAEASPNKLYGIGNYVDLRLSRWIQIEGEARWSHFNEYLGINENNYFIGIREPIGSYGRVTPYGKALAGAGNGRCLDKWASVYGIGGGVDYRLNKHFRLRAFDFDATSLHREYRPFL